MWRVSVSVSVGVGVGEERGVCSGRCGREGAYLCLSHFGVGGDVAVVLFGDLGFGLAEVFAGCVEGGFGHDWCSGILDWLFV